MKIPEWDIEARAVVVLGAGATRGASFIREDQPARVLPPLDRDFFAQVNKIRTDQDNVETLLEFKHGEFGFENQSMEAFFTHVEFLNTLETELRKKKGPKPVRYRKQLETFKQVLAAVFEESLEGNECRYHEALVKVLQPEDVIISFNYDCLIDVALQKHGGKRWEPRTGYGISVKTGSEAWTPTKKGKGPGYSNPVKLLKMHGSLHWKWTDKGGLHLKEDPYTRKHGNLSFEIIPPAWYKPITRKPYRDVWIAARSAVERAQLLAIVGYSAPPTDLLSQALLRQRADTTRHLEVLIIANRNAETRTKLLSLVEGAIGPKTRTIESNSLGEFARLLGLPQSNI
jgi:hypothetical protein